MACSSGNPPARRSRPVRRSAIPIGAWGSEVRRSAPLRLSRIAKAQSVVVRQTRQCLGRVFPASRWATASASTTEGCRVPQPSQVRMQVGIRRVYFIINSFLNLQLDYRIVAIDGGNAIRISRSRTARCTPLYGQLCSNRFALARLRYNNCSRALPGMGGPFVSRAAKAG